MIQVFPFEYVEGTYYRKQYLAITNIDEVRIQKTVRILQGTYDTTYHLIYKGEIVERKNATVSREATCMEIDEIDRKYVKQLLLTQASKPSFVQFIKEIE